MTYWNDFVTKILTINNETNNNFVGMVIVDDNAKIHQSANRYYLGDDILPPPLQFVKSTIDYSKLRRQRRQEQKQHHHQQQQQQKRQVTSVISSSSSSSSSFRSTYTDLMLAHRQIKNIVGMNNNYYYSDYKQTILERKPILRYNYYYARNGQNHNSRSYIRLTNLSNNNNTITSLSVQKQKQQQKENNNNNKYNNRKIKIVNKDNNRGLPFGHHNNNRIIPIISQQQQRLKRKVHYRDDTNYNTTTTTEKEKDSLVTLRMEFYCSPQA